MRTNGQDTFTLSNVRVYFASEEFLDVREDDEISIVGVVYEIKGSTVNLRNAYIYKE